MAGTAVWVDVLPSLKGFGSALTSGVLKQASIAGSKAGKAFTSSLNQTASTSALTEQVKKLQAAQKEAEATVQSLTDQTEQLKAAEKRCANEVQNATRAIAKARDEQKTAAMNVEAAEKRLQEVTKKNGEGSSQAATAAARLNDARSKLRQKTEATSRAEDTLRAAKAAQKETTEQLKSSEDKLSHAKETLTKTTSRLENETAKSDKQANSLKNRFKQWASAASSAKSDTDKLNQSTMTLGDVSGKAAGKIGALAGVASSVFNKAMSTVTGSISSAIERTDLMNNFPKVMSNLGFSAQDAAKSVQKISGALDGLPTTSSAMTGMVQQLAPLTKGLDEATSISLAFNNAMLAGGASTAEQENALTQYTQMLAAGKVDMAAWRSIQAAMPGQLNQLGEALLGAGKNGNDLYEAMKDGTVSFEQFNKAVIELNEKGTGAYASFAEQAKASTQGIGTAMENMKNRVAKQIQKVIEAFGVDQIASAINGFTSRFALVGDAAAGMVTKAKGYLSDLYAKLEDIGAIDTLKGAWGKLVGAFQGIQWESLLPTRVLEGFSWTAAHVFGTVIDAVWSFTDTLGKGVRKVGEFLNGFAQTGVIGVWIDVFGAVIDVVASVNDLFWKVIQRILGLNNASGQMQSFGGTVGNVFKGVAGFIRPVLEKLDDFANWCYDHAEVITGALVGIGSAVAAWKIAGIVAIAVDWFGRLPSVIMLAKGAMSGLNAVMAANPIGIVISAIGALVGAFTWFFTQTETGRAAWKSFTDWFSNTWNSLSGWFGGVMNAIGNAWQSVCDAFNTAWTWIDQTVIQPFKTAIDAIGNALQWFNDTIVQPVWNAIKTAFQIAFLAISTAVILPFKLAIDGMGAVFTWLYETVIQPVWNSISNAFQTAWTFIDTNIVQPFQTAWQALGDFFGLVGDGLMTAWQWVVDVFQAGWQWIDSNVVQPFKLAWEILKAGFQAVGDGLRTAWQWVVDNFQAGWQWIDSNVVQSFRTAWQGVKDFFSGVGTSLKNTWEGVKNSFKSVWDWIDKNVINPFRKGFESLGKAVQNMKDAASKAFEALKDACATPVRWIVEVVYTNGIQKTWNGIAGAVGLDNLKLPDAPKFARGGVSGGINPGYAPRHDTILAMTSPGEAWMVPEWTRAVGADNVYRWNAMARHQGVDAVRQDMGLDGYKTGGVVQHFDGGGISGLWNGLKNGVSNAWDWAKQKASDIADAVKAFVKDPGAWITSKILNPVKSLLGGITGGSWGQIVAQLPIRTVQGLIEKAKAAVSRKKEAGELSTVEYTPSAGVEQWRDLVIECLKEVGQPVSLVNSVLRRMNQESGGNPNAINNWDVNAKNGVPSQGLMQTIPPTFKAYAGKYANRPITDPKANIIASMNYALARYGSLSAAYDRAGGYKTGGIVPMATGAKLYDQGGVLEPGVTVVENRTRQPELVLTREQIMERFAIPDTWERSMSLNVNIPERSDPWSDAAIWVNTAKSMIGGR